MSGAPKIKPVWFLPRTRDQPVVEAMALGNLILNPHYPDEPINRSPPPVVPVTALRRREEAAWSWAKEFERSRSGGLFATFLQIAGVGAEVEASNKHAHTELFNADRLVTEEFVPDRQYLAKLLEDEDVSDVLTGPHRKSKAYLVTGLKIAYGATKATEIMRRNGQHAQIGVDASASGLPVSAGLKGSHSSKMTESLTAAGKTDFVFAFKLRELRYKQKNISSAAYDRGAQFGLTKEESKNEEADDEDEMIDLDALENVDIQVSDLEMQQRTVIINDDLEVDYLFPHES